LGSSCKSCVLGSISSTFYIHTYQSVRTQLSFQYLFTLLGTTCVKAVRRTLMKSTPDWRDQTMVFPKRDSIFKLYFTFFCRFTGQTKSRKMKVPIPVRVISFNRKKWKKEEKEEKQNPICNREHWSTFHSTVWRCWNITR